MGIELKRVFSPIFSRGFRINHLITSRKPKKKANSHSNAGIHHYTVDLLHLMRINHRVLLSLVMLGLLSGNPLFRGNLDMICQTMCRRYFTSCGNFVTSSDLFTLE
ncbi:hypothetical protein AVEN_184304-1 [Araneus ventricosus]|uniref:Uncharacterized protein n=1 Tax=Araneus ventricosus TaxID=182803 RepID=A0A4Y2KDT2_ARAVE|nr:hypothetical protein AVEN_184304-1 [Araneus ventricosus]